MKNELLTLNLRLFDGAPANTTTATGMAVEMKTFYDRTLIENAEPELVHDQWAQTRDIPQNGGKTIELRKYDQLPKALTPLTEGVTPVSYTHLAGYGFANLLPEGNDIVCAAISVLGQTAAQCIMDMSDAGKVGIKEMTIKDALIDIKAIPKQIHKSELDTMVKTIKTGCELLEKAHPAYISLGWET